MYSERPKGEINRRDFLHSAAAAGAGLALPQRAPAQSQGSREPDDINVALLGAGSQGRVLMNSCLKIPGIRFRAVCDIWADYNQKRVFRMLKAYRHEHNTYADYREMLDKEKDLIGLGANVEGLIGIKFDDLAKYYDDEDVRRVIRDRLRDVRIKTIFTHITGIGSGIGEQERR